MRFAARRSLSNLRACRRFVFNAAPHRATTLLEDARAIVEGAGLAVAPVVLRERGVYRSAWPLSKTVVEIEPVGKAALEIAHLKDWVFEQLQMCTAARVQKNRSSRR